VDDSLSIIVPVRDAEATLSEQVGQLLDVLPDLTSRFEIIVVDDGSIDHTVEAARDLERKYPQLRLICHAQSRGIAAAVKSGLQRALGQTVLVKEDRAALSPTDLRRLWSLRSDRGMVMARTQQRPGLLDPDLVERLCTWGQALKNLAKRVSPGGIQMIRRDGAQALAGGNSFANDPQLTTTTIADTG
jgi:glycosyltransferase involved in cell wall biosynthesis